MSPIISISLAAMLFTSLGCGKGNDVIACDRRESPQLLGGTCSDWNKTKQADHKAVGMCGDEGDVPRKEECPSEGRVGTCDVRNEEKHYYSPKFTAEGAKKECGHEDGVWKP